MATKGKSRWADDEDESAEAIAPRKREKEEKKRLKEEKLRRADAQRSNAESPIQSSGINGEAERPSKRVKTSEETEQPSNGTGGESKLLQFPVRRFGACRSVEEYERLNDIEEGSYGLVSRAQDKTAGTVVALKKLKMDYANDGFPVTGLREIQILMASRHPHIVFLREVVMGSTLKE